MLELDLCDLSSCRKKARGGSGKYIYIYIYIYRIIPLTKQRTNASFLIILYLLLLVHWFGNLVWGSQQVIMEHGLGDAFDPI